MNRIQSLFLLGAVGAALAGCTTTLVFPISGGGQAPVQMGDHGPVKTEQDGILIQRAGMDPIAASKSANYAFDVVVHDGRAPLSIVVEDVTDAQPVLLAQDSHPYLKGNLWHFTSPSKVAGDPDLAWTTTIEDSFRIYRFTIVKADGKQAVLFQAVSYPAFLKAYVRKILGMNY